MRFATIPMGSPSPLLAAADDLPFTQPPEILNHDMPPPPPRVLSVATRDPEIRPSSQFYIPARITLFTKDAIAKMLRMFGVGNLSATVLSHILPIVCESKNDVFNQKDR